MTPTRHFALAVVWCQQQRAAGDRSDHGADPPAFRRNLVQTFEVPAAVARMVDGTSGRTGGWYSFLCSWRNCSASSKCGVFSSPVIVFQRLPSRLAISVFFKSGSVSRILRRSICDQTKKAFIGLLMCWLGFFICCILRKQNFNRLVHAPTSSTVKRIEELENKPQHAVYLLTVSLFKFQCFPAGHKVAPKVKLVFSI